MEREERDRGRERPQALMLLRKRLLRSQSVADVQVSAFKALTGSAPAKQTAQRLDSLVRVSRRVERDQKKNACM